MEYKRRVVDDELDELLTELPAGALVRADPNLVLNGAPPVLIDEWQREPAVWDAVRRTPNASQSLGSGQNRDPEDAPDDTRRAWRR